MQIFFLSTDQRLCAQYLCDKHCVKMPTETAQILSTVWWNSNDLKAFDWQQRYGLYKPVRNKSHPVIRWVQQSTANYRWTVELLKQLCIEFEFRYGHKHACERFVPLFETTFGLPPLLSDDWIPMSQNFQALPDEFKDDDPVLAYWLNYAVEKRRFAVWNKKRQAPTFWQELVAIVVHEAG